MEKDVAILDIGSHKLVFAIARKSSKGIYTVKNFATLEYPGYFDGQWVEGNMLGSDVQSLIEKSGYKGGLNTIYVGVPSCFIKIRTQEYAKDFGKEKLITNSVLEEFLNECDLSESDNKYMVISSSATNYLIDNNKNASCVIDERATRLKANISFVTCQKSFAKLFDSILGMEGFQNVAYISSAWAVNCKLLDFETKNKGALVVDVGFVNSSCSYQKGEGVDKLATISMGGANIADDLANFFSCDFYEARTLLGKVNLDSDDSLVQEYNVTIGNSIYTVNGHNIIQIAKYRLDMFVNFIQTFISELDTPLEKIPVFITGGGITFIRGAVPYLEKQLKHTIRVLIADIPQYDRPCYSSFVAVVDVANEINSNKKKLKKLFG